MSRSTMANRRAVLFDKSLELRDATNPEITADFVENPIDFPATKQQFFKAVVFTPGYSGYAATTVQWEAVVEVSDQIAGTYTEVGRAILKSENQQGDEVQIPLEGSFIEDVLPTANYIRVRTEKVGSPGALTYGAYLSC